VLKKRIHHKVSFGAREQGTTDSDAVNQSYLTGVLRASAQVRRDAESVAQKRAVDVDPELAEALAYTTKYLFERGENVDEEAEMIHMIFITFKILFNGTSGVTEEQVKTWWATESTGKPTIVSNTGVWSALADSLGSSPPTDRGLGGAGYTKRKRRRTSRRNPKRRYKKRTLKTPRNRHRRVITPMAPRKSRYIE